MDMVHNKINCVFLEWYFLLNLAKMLPLLEFSVLWSSCMYVYIHCY